MTPQKKMAKNKMMIMESQGNEKKQSADRELNTLSP